MGKRAAIPGENKSNRLNNQATQPKSLRKEVFQGADIKGQNSSPGIAGKRGCLSFDINPLMANHA